MMDIAIEHPEEVPVTKEIKKPKKLTVKRVLKMSIEQLFSRDPQMKEQFKLVHNIFGTHGVCLARKSECECISSPSECEYSENWLADFLISTLVSFTQSDSLEQEMHVGDADAMLVHQQSKAALQIVKVTFDCSKEGANMTLLKALNNG